MNTSQNQQIKNFINCYLFEHIEEVSNKFIYLLKSHRVCEFTEADLGRAKHGYALGYQSQILDFLNGILQDEPLRHTGELMDRWKNSEIRSECNMHPILPEDIIAYYTILKEALFSFIIPYATDRTKTMELSLELSDLEAAIQKCVTETYKKLQLGAA